MVWGHFSPVHIATLILAAAMIAGLYFVLRGCSRQVQTGVLGVLSFAGIAAILWNLWPFDNVLPNLPLHLCSLNAMVLPFAVFSRNKQAGNLLLVWGLGAVAALVLNNECVEMKLLSWNFVFYYFPHVMECGIPILLFALGHVKKDHRCIGPTLGITFVCYTVIHAANLAINAYSEANGLGIEVNFMFSIRPNNPLTDLFYGLIPHSYFYMLLVLPIAAVYLLVVYLPQLRRALPGRKQPQKTA